MALHDDLLAQALHLATKERRRPKQASLRRATSAAYYALFHLLVDETVHFVVRGTGRDGLRHQLARGFEHGQMRAAARAFSGTGQSPWTRILTAPPSSALRSVATTFGDLQQERHDADYNLAQPFTRARALAAVASAQAAFSSWANVRAAPEAEAFMLALLVRTRD
jgi:hypothetical protein